MVKMIYKPERDCAKCTGCYNYPAPPDHICESCRKGTVVRVLRSGRFFSRIQESGKKSRLVMTKSLFPVRETRGVVVIRRKI